MTAPRADLAASAHADTQAGVVADAGQHAVPWQDGNGERADAGVRTHDGADDPGRLRAPGRRRGGGRGSRAEQPVVPPAEFQSYYNRPIVKAPGWREDIPAYLFLGGLAAGSSLLGAGGDLTGRPGMRRAGRVAGLGAISASFGFLVHDLGRPSRFVHMLRVAKPTSPMSMGTWLLTAYGPLAGIAAAAEALPVVRRRKNRIGRLARGPLGKILGGSARPAGLVAAAVAPAVASYTAVLLSDTAMPSWHDAYPELPFVFCGSAAAASGGLQMITTSTAEATPARRLAVAAAVAELVVSRRMEHRMGLTGEPFGLGHAGTLSTLARVLTAGGATLAALAGRRSRVASVIAGAALLGGSACTRFAVFEAGVASARDPRYTVIPQRRRADAALAARSPNGTSPVEPV